jgi:glyoxylase-like metal-dependent hydrolase (beta-lactamase superfamily II)
MADTMRPTRQEQESARNEITEVAPGVLRLQLPISMPGLGHVNCYALEDERGVTLVDPGLPGPDSWDALMTRLEAAGLPLRRVHTVVVTHSHPDHHGGANPLRRATGADIVTHRSFRDRWAPVGDDQELDARADPHADADAEARAKAGASWEAALASRGNTPWGGQFGPSAEDMQRARDRGVEPGAYAAPAPTRVLSDADTVRLGRRDWVALHTPGHTADHLCLYAPEDGTLLSGDHVLPSITPHISGIGAGDDALADFFASLERMHDLVGVKVVLPAHGHPFADLDGRVDAIRRHHDERLDVLSAAGRRLGPATVQDLSHELFQPRSWGSMAESETYAHLEHLRLAGHATREETAGRLLYTLT